MTVFRPYCTIPWGESYIEGSPSPLPFKAFSIPLSFKAARMCGCIQLSRARTTRRSRLSTIRRLVWFPRLNACLHLSLIPKHLFSTSTA